LLSFWDNKTGGEFGGWGKHAELAEFENGEFQQWYIACAPGHPFLKFVIETVFRNIRKYNPVFDGVGKHGVLRVTGPVAYTMAIRELLATSNHRIVDSCVDFGFEYNIYRSNSHVSVFQSHYSKQTTPVVKMGFIQATLTTVLLIIRNMVRPVRQLLRSKFFATLL